MKPIHATYMTSLNLSSEELLCISQDIRCGFRFEDLKTVTELVILPVDPFHVHVYWSLEDQQLFGADDDGIELVLRLFWDNKHDYQAELNCHFNVKVNARSSQQTVRVPVDNTSYSAVIGWLDYDQNLNVLARSNTVHVPRAGQLFAGNQSTRSEIAVEMTLIAADRSESAKTPDNFVLDEALVHANIMQVLQQSANEITDTEPMLQSIPAESELLDGIDKQSDYDEARVDHLITQKLIDLEIEPEDSGKGINSGQNYAASNPSGYNFHA